VPLKIRAATRSGNNSCNHSLALILFSHACCSAEPAEKEEITIEITDALGRRVRQLFSHNVDAPLKIPLLGWVFSFGLQKSWGNP